VPPKQQRATTAAHLQPGGPGCTAPQRRFAAEGEDNSGFSVHDVLQQMPDLRLAVHVVNDQMRAGHVAAWRKAVRTPCGGSCVHALPVRSFTGACQQVEGAPFRQARLGAGGELQLDRCAPQGVIAAGRREAVPQRARSGALADAPCSVRGGQPHAPPMTWPPGRTWAMQPPPLAACHDLYEACNLLIHPEDARVGTAPLGSGPARHMSHGVQVLLPRIARPQCRCPHCATNPRAQLPQLHTINRDQQPLHHVRWPDCSKIHCSYSIQQTEKRWTLF
jgi:hypothetical protein